MAKIEQIYNKPATKRFSCRIELSEINQKTEEEMVRLSKTASIKGFRVGHAPIKVIKGLYFAKSYNEIADNMIRATIEDILKEHQFKLTSHPSVKLNEEEKEAVVFEITFDLIPEVPSSFDFKKVEVETFEPEISKEDIDKELDLIAKRNKSFSLKDGASEMGDAVIIDTIGRIDGIAFEGGKLDDYNLELGSGAFIPGFEEQLIGKLAGESVIVTVTFPTEYHAKNLAGKEAQFFTKIKEVKKSEEAKVDEDLAKKMSFENLEALSNDVKSKIIAFYTNAHKENLKKEVFDKISKLLDFDLPEGTVERVAEDILKEKNLPETEIENVKTEARERLRLSFFLNHIGQENKIATTQQDFTNFIVKSASDMGVNPFAMLEFYSKDEDAKKRLEVLLQENKIYDFIFERISLKKSTLSKEQFDKILKQE